MLIWFAVLTLLMLAWQFYQREADTVDTIAYNPNFIQLVATNQVVEAEIYEEISGRQYIVGQRRELDPRTGKARRMAGRTDRVVDGGTIAWFAVGYGHSLLHFDVRYGLDAQFSFVTAARRCGTFSEHRKRPDDQGQYDSHDDRDDQDGSRSVLIVSHA